MAITTTKALIGKLHFVSSLLCCKGRRVGRSRVCREMKMAVIWLPKPHLQLMVAFKSDLLQVTEGIVEGQARKNKDPPFHLGCMQQYYLG